MSQTNIYPGAIIELEFILSQQKPKNIFLVTGKKYFEACGAKRKISKIISNYSVTHFNDFDPNPDSKDVEKGIDLFNKNKCDWIISIGGGSSIDMAKLISYFHNSKTQEISIFNLKNINYSPTQHICIPTTSGSGSEATHFAVMYIGDNKFSIAEQSLIPSYVIIDPEFHYSQTPYQKAVSGADALAQAIESFWSIQSTKESHKYSEKALKVVWNNLPQAVNNGDELAHLYVAIGAHLAGKAINIAKTTAPNAFSYGFTKYAGLPHGHSVMITLPYF